MRNYKCLKNRVFENSHYSLLPIRDEDKVSIMNWRNEQIDVLRQKEPLTLEKQDWYFKNVISPLFEQANPPQILWSFFKQNELIGYGGLVHISWEDKRGEVSFLLNPARIEDNHTYREDFLNYLSLLSRAAFEDLSFNKIYTETFDIRDFHISVLEEAGFLKEAILKRHWRINNQWVDSIFHCKFQK
ncbi:GNAT family N-acetyltransferase [Runella sp. SP2]|nr:GNAT family N-acetyltransferase [Runella sp. SP2]